MARSKRTDDFAGGKIKMKPRRKRDDLQRKSQHPRQGKRRE
jgi:hypothetical protein